MSRDIEPIHPAQLRTVADLLQRGWSDVDVYRADLRCPRCGSTTDRERIEPKPGESRIETCERVLFDAGWWSAGSDDYQLYHSCCDLISYRRTTPVVDARYRGDERLAYDADDLPVRGTDPNRRTALLALKHYHESADTVPEVESLQADLGIAVRRECPLCLQPAKPDFDYHHWSYDPHIGVALCRECHMGVHRDMTATEQANASWSGDWVDDALGELVRLHREHRAVDADAGIEPEVLAVRYNVPYSTDRIRRAMGRVDAATTP